MQQRQLTEAARAGSHAHGPAAHRGSVQPPPPAQPRIVRAAEPSKRYSVFDRLANEEQNSQSKAHAAAEVPAYAARQGPHSTVQVLPDCVWLTFSACPDVLLPYGCYTSVWCLLTFDIASLVSAAAVGGAG